MHRSHFVNFHTPIVVGALLVSLLSGCSKQPAHDFLKSNDSVAVEPGVSIGSVHSGMTMKQVVTELGEPVTNQDRMLTYSNTWVFFTKDGFVGYVYYLNPSTNGSSTDAFAGRTKEGIGIGSSRADVISAYGEPTATRPEYDHNENEVMIYESLRIQFHIRNGKVYLIAVYFKK
jgi:hypothetical protein